MGKVTREEWYRRVNAEWPENLPPLTADEAAKAARKLYRFAMRKTFTGQVKITSGSRYTWIRRRVLYVNPDKGWKSMVHLLSHWFDNALSPSTRPHASAHARMELRLIKEVKKRGWLDGTLKAPEKPAAALEPDKPVKTAAEIKYARLQARKANWEKKQTRAENALKKIARQMKYYERKLQIAC